MEHYTKKQRIYLTSKSYLKSVQRICLFFAGVGAISCGLIFFTMGLTFVSLGVMGGVGIVSLLLIWYIWKNARSVSLKAGNIILKTMANQHVVAPIGSIRKVKTIPMMGYQFTRIRYHIDGGLSKFFVLTKPSEVTPEAIIKKEIAASRKRKTNPSR